MRTFAWGFQGPSTNWSRTMAAFRGEEARSGPSCAKACIIIHDVYYYNALSRLRRPLARSACQLMCCTNLPLFDESIDNPTDPEKSAFPDVCPM